MGKIKFNPAFKMISFPCPIILATINTINTTATAGANGVAFWVNFGKYWLRMIPKVTGSKTTFTVLKNKPQASTDK